MASELYELKIKGVNGMQPTETVLHFIGGNLTADDTGDNGAFLIDAFITNLEALFLGCCSGLFFIDSYEARRATPKPSIVAFHQYQPSVQIGTYGGGQKLDQLCPCVRIIPTMGFKSVGRIFMPGLPATAIVNNAYDSIYVTAVAAWTTAMFVNFGTSGKTWQLAVYSRKLNVYSIAVGGGLSDRFGFQKRRRVSW